MNFRCGFLQIVAILGMAMPAAAEEGFSPLISPSDFHGDHVHGWTQRGGVATYHVDGDAIVGTSKPDTPNTFLCSNKLYGDFELKLEVKIDEGLNSGIQIRSECFDEPITFEFPGADGQTHQKQIAAGRVHGYQVEIDPTDRAYSGGIYDEARRGWLFDLAGDDLAEARAAFKRTEWNHYRILAQGNRIRTWINDVPAADLTDDMTARGFIALQVHSIGSPDLAGKQVRWRRLMIKSLDVN